MRVNNSKGVVNFQSITNNSFNQEVRSRATSVSKFVSKTNKTTTPSESEFISINRRRTYHYNEEG